MTSAAAGERCFSVYGGTNTKKRNRMPGPTLDKMVRVRLNSKQLKRDVVDFDRDENTLPWFYLTDYKIAWGHSTNDTGNDDTDDDTGGTYDDED